MPRESWRLKALTRACGGGEPPEHHIAAVRPDELDLT